MNALVQVIVFTADVARLRDFYTGALGLGVLEDSPGWCRLDAGGCVLALHALPKEPMPPDPAPAREDSYLKIGFHTEDVDARRAELAARGVRMRDVHRFGDLTFCDGLDPDGNVFQITSRRAP
jgi:catechol 2,3-dioxygenase-like lactoylglutathione lyase family enzyme